MPAILSTVYGYLAANLIMGPEDFDWSRSIPALFLITDAVVDFTCTNVYSSPESGGLMVALLGFAGGALFSSFTMGGIAGMALTPRIAG